MTTSDTAVHTQPFQAEVSELLHLMVHSVYSETDIFLRELLSNASDACDRLRYEAIAIPSLLGEGEALKVRIIPNKPANTLTIADNGIGMERQELVDHLGTIARSGTKAFVSKLKEAKDGLGLIGQFGVGFYSAFMVAEKIVVISRRAGESDVWTWTSSGGSGFEIARASDEDAARVARGTEIVLHLKDDAKKYLETYEIERIVGAYSDNILFPIELVPGEGEPRQINSASALWQRSKSELTADDYKKAYQQIASAFGDPAITLHYRAEGRHSYAVLLFAPSTKPFDLFEPNRKGRVKLYVRRVFITDDADLLPGYLRFIRGVVDSEDLPLNISREMLQNNPQLAQIRKAVATRVLSELESLAEKDPENFAKIWDAFGAVLKEGIYEDFERREKLLALSRFTTTSGEKRSLKQIIADFKPNQTEIYYLVGDSIERLKSNPRLEAATARGIEVLLLSDPVDAFWTSMPSEFEGKPLKSLSQGDLNLDLIPRVDETDEAKEDEPAADEAATIAVIKAALGERVSDVKASTRLTSSASCLVAGTDGPSRELERILSQQNRGMRTKPILEINLRHPMVAAITRAEAGSKAVDDLSLLLLEQAQILDGELPEHAAAFAARLNRLVLQGLGR
ncbi:MULTISPECIES: molecular chaperone HtpG [Bradyrhizobium]|jgi:molecular chaperone HtpG|uniref:Chaperone protein HtpG n=2 Tax=Bradyrhizobium elkanii TaxID=29448 RepID=A0A8I1Y0I7_BRAEL|nr:MULTISPECIES: molecular chaperone HtpG [Bradyrhizobium]MBP1290337.1 molecular chaperone HtpG [Bradyrhizobium elkanii]MCP1975445.1 molecular chaperone HtpG [Bradyrhizobium elkanii]MCS3525106.1 molecular chaperone HtpG [Bradyrhizobium elkanii]MCS4075682.1 molecular chaperone HtpG [Bradyrhizobium elkanii]MCS4085069.1 molecular chaperone HtpG [Bradyrhizobium elkanii]